MEIKKILEKLENHEKRIEKLESQLKGTSKKELDTSISELFRSKRVKNDVQKTLIIGYYLERYKDFDCFNTKDVEKGFNEARETPPSNIPDKINKNIRKGHIKECDNGKNRLKAYKLTKSGVEHINNNFKE